MGAVDGGSLGKDRNRQDDSGVFGMCWRSLGIREVSTGA